MNPAKPELGKVSKKIFEKKIMQIRKVSGLHSWKNTDAVIDWFKNLRNKKNMRFIVFDVEKFYPSISKELLVQAVKWARKYVDISDEEIDVVMKSRMAMMFVDGSPWVKKDGELFDVGMGFFDGAECCEIVGLFLLAEMKENGIVTETGIYRDDGLSACDLPAREVENLKKKMCEVFRKHKLEITIEANKKRVEFLDVYFDLEKEEFGPYRKPGDNPVYVSSESNHPRSILNNIPVGINKRLCRISASKDIFDKAVPDYQEALSKSGYNHILKYEENDNQPGSSVPKRKRSRKVIYFNPPYSKNVKTNVGKKFLQLMDKHFPPGNPLNKIFNRNCVKMSYRCTANLGRKIAAHNAKFLKTETDGALLRPKECSCRNKEMCPVQNKCLSECVVYQAIVKRSDGVTDSYVGLTENSFKDRRTKHKSSFKTRNPKNASGLSRYV